MSKRRKPAALPPERDHPVNFRCPTDLLSKIDAWIAENGQERSRSTAIRLLLTVALDGKDTNRASHIETRLERLEARLTELENASSASSSRTGAPGVRMKARE